MPRATALFDHPFIGGYRSDLDSWSLPATSFREGQDVIWPRGVAALRGGWSNTLTANVFGSTSADYYYGVRTHRFDPSDESEVSVCITTPNGDVGFADGAGSDLGKGQGGSMWDTNGIFPRAGYLGEILLCSRNGVESVMRLGARTHGTATRNASGTVVVTHNSPIVTGTGTSFTTEAFVGAYIRLGSSGAPALSTFHRIVRIDSTTQLAVDAPIQAPTPYYAGAAITHEFVAFGPLGPCSIVYDQGDATFPATAASNVTGRGTKWLTEGGSTQGRVNAGFAKDIIGRRGSWGGATSVETLSGEAALDIDGYSTAASNVSYAIARNLIGCEACVHQNQLFVANLQWARNRLQWCVPGASLSRIDNGNDSIDTNYLDARLADYQDVPDPRAPGEIEALLSVPEGPLLILRTPDSHLGWGLGGPSFEVDLLDAGAGCADKWSAVVGEGGAYWVGDKGVFRYTGGRSTEELTSGHINRELRALMTDFDPSADHVAGILVDGHYVIAIDSSQGTRTFAYNIAERNWSPPMSSMTFWAAHSSRLDTDDAPAYIVPTQTRQLGEVTGTFRDEGEADQGDHLGEFQADLPFSAAGHVNRLATPTDLKITAQVRAAAASGTAELAVAVGNSDVLDPDDSGSVAERSDAGMSTELIEPLSDVSLSIDSALGLEGRDAFVRLTQDGSGVPSAIRVEAIEVQVRQRRPNA